MPKKKRPCGNPANRAPGRTTPPGTKPRSRRRVRHLANVVPQRLTRGVCEAVLDELDHLIANRREVHA